MSVKLIAFRLKKQGKSFGEIAKTLSISKTTAFEYVKEMNLALEQNKRLQSLKDADATTASNPKAQLAPNQHESKNSLSGDIMSSVPLNSTNPLTESTEPKLEQLQLKEFTGDDLIKKEFECLAFEGKFLELIGKPSRVFSGIIWGMPKGGKSNFALRFADYLQEYFGQVLYVAAEEGESVTLQEKFKDIDGSKVTVIETRDRDKIRAFLQQRQEFGFIFIDSINNAGIDNDFLELLKGENQNRSFISIVQATKSGKFKGDQALTHNCDFIITVDKGVASHQGRFNVASEINIFEDGALYQKNPVQKVKETAKATAPTEKKSDATPETNTLNGKPAASIEDLQKEIWLDNYMKAIREKAAKTTLPNNPPTKPLPLAPTPKRNELQMPTLSKEGVIKLGIGAFFGFLAIRVYELIQEQNEKNTKQVKGK
ncbi:MAG: hypothetical protein QM530_08030 [Phycisphaerales bacterium]|nr:hypothetical protein [Phycisphaerales bacterium]